MVNEMNWYAKLCQTVVDMLENKSNPISNDGLKDSTKDNDMGLFSDQEAPLLDNWDGDMEGGFGYDPEDYKQPPPQYSGRAGIENTPPGMWERAARSFTPIAEMTDIHVVNSMALLARLHAARVKAAGAEGEIPVFLISSPYGNWTSKYMELSRELRDRAKKRSKRNPLQERRERLRRQHGERRVADFDRLFQAFSHTRGPAFQEFQNLLQDYGYTIPKNEVAGSTEGQLRFIFEGG